MVATDDEVAADLAALASATDEHEQEEEGLLTIHEFERIYNYHISKAAKPAADAGEQAPELQELRAALLGVFSAKASKGLLSSRTDDELLHLCSQALAAARAAAPTPTTATTAAPPPSPAAAKSEYQPLRVPVEPTPICDTARELVEGSVGLGLHDVPQRIQSPGKGCGLYALGMVRARCIWGTWQWPSPRPPSAS